MRKIKIILFFLGLLLSILILLMKTPDGLSRQGQNALSIFVFAVTMWISGALPLPVTGISVFALLSLFKVLPVKTVFSLFGSNAVFFILGAFILAAAMMKTKLSTRFSLHFLRGLDRSPVSLFTGIFLISAFLAFWMPEHAVAALMLPVVLEIAGGLKLTPLKENYGKILFLAIAWGSIIGGVATFLGGARNPLAVGMLYENYNMTISFARWMLAVVPIVIITLAIVWILMKTTFKIDIPDVSKAKRTLTVKIKEMGKMGSAEKGTAIIMIVTILSWIFLSELLGLAVIALLGSLLLFIFKIITWKDIENYINWGIILMYGGAIALGSALEITGAAAWLAHSIIGDRILSPYLFIFTISIVSIFLTEGMSNVAAVACILPVAFSLGRGFGINPIITTFAVAVPSGLAFCLPISTPANAIAYSSGYYRIKDSLKLGIFLNIISLLIFNFMVRFFWPLIGLKP
ncbi:DASS family sodium-coupled anion symporter [candidate division WOR-3 bacterium]|nr:DASS family sodium-coupled anion symporter [candidate division WOR-3 bacterium]